MNFTNLTPMYMPRVTEIDALQVYKDICVGFDSQVIKIFFFLFIFMFIRKVILPRSWYALENINKGKFKEQIDMIFNFYMNTIDGVILLGFVYILGVFYVNGLTSGYKVFVNIVIGLFIFTILFKLFFIIKDGGIRKFFIKSKQIYKKFEDNARE